MTRLRLGRMGQKPENAGITQNMDQIYRDYAKTVYGFLYSKTNNREVAEELTQETFYQAIKSSSQYNGDSSVLTWLCSIAKHQWFNYCRRQKVQEKYMTEPVDLVEESVEHQVIEKMTHSEVLAVMNQLDEPAREIMRLRIHGELSFREIVEIYGKSENWARVTFYRGKEKVLKEVKKHEI